MNELQQLVEEIEQLREQLLVVQESLFADDSEVEALEESIKEKVGEFGKKSREKFYDLVAKKFRNMEKLQQAIDKAERQNAEMQAEIEKREIDGEKFRAKLGRFVWYGLVGNLAPLFGPNVKPTKMVKNAIKFNNMWMSALNRRKAELEGGKEEAAQESMELKALMFDLNVMQTELSYVKESTDIEDSELEALEESIKEKAIELDNKVKSKIYGAVCDMFKKPDGRIDKYIAKVEKDIEKIEGVLNKRAEERDSATVMRIIKQSAAAALAPWIFSIIMNMSKNAQPSFLLKNTLRVDKLCLAKLKERKAELEAKNAEPAQESAGLDFELEFLDDEE